MGSPEILGVDAEIPVNQSIARRDDRTPWDQRARIPYRFRDMGRETVTRSHNAHAPVPLEADG